MTTEQEVKLLSTMGDDRQLISSMEVSGGTITIRADDEFAHDFLRDDFSVSYTIDGSVPEVPDELAVVPFLANVAPIVWLEGMDVRVPILDREFAKALTALQRVFSDMYPSLRWSGSITADRLTTRAPATKQVATLFSGGVDSVYSALSIGEPQMLVTVRGSDIALSNDAGWDAVRDQAIRFARERGHRNAFIESNFRQFLNIPALENRSRAVEDWWGHVQHGLGLLGLVAPLVHAGHVVIAATHSPGFTGEATASNPTLDTTVRWGGVSVNHHGYEASRQGKVEAIARGEGPTPELRVCYSNPYGDGGNCGRCEKCLRTYAALVVAGANPVNYGFSLPPAKGARLIRRRFATYRVAFTVNKAWHWQEIQSSLRAKAGRDDDSLRCPARFARWLSAFDFSRYERRWQFFLRTRKRLLRTLRRFPVAESAARRCVAASHMLRGWLRRNHHLRPAPASVAASSASRSAEAT